MPGHGPRSGGDPLPPPVSDGIPHQRRIYNVVDPASLARVYAAAYTGGLARDLDFDGVRTLAETAVKDFLNLMREPFND